MGDTDTDVCYVIACIKDLDGVVYLDFAESNRVEKKFVKMERR